MSSSARVDRGDYPDVVPTVIVVLLVVILALLLLGALVGLALKLLWFALTGLVIGALARLVLPGRQNISILATALIGIAASLLGGMLAVALAALGITLYASTERRRV